MFGGVVCKGKPKPASHGDGAICRHRGWQVGCGKWSRPPCPTISLMLPIQAFIGNLLGVEKIKKWVDRVDALINVALGFEFDTRNATDTLTANTGANFLQVGESFVKPFEKPIAKLDGQTVGLAKAAENCFDFRLWFAGFRVKFAVLRDKSSERVVADLEAGVNCS